MNVFVFLIFSLVLAPHSNAGISCEGKFDALEELRISSFDSAASAADRRSCIIVAQKFFKNAGSPPHGCNGAKALIKDWSDSYHNDTQKTLPPDPTAAYVTIKQWAYQTLKTKCAKRQFN